MDWSMVHEFPGRSYDAYYAYYDDNNMQPMPAQHVATQAQPYPTNQTFSLLHSPPSMIQPPPPPTDMAAKGDNPREIRNKAEKQRRDKMNQSIADLASIVPPVVASGRKLDKTSVLKLTAHYLRAHQYVFGDSINSAQQFTGNSARALLSLLKGFILTITYKGIVVVVSQNVHQYLGYTELDLIGQSIFNITHKDDHQMLREQLMPKSHLLGTNGELLIPDEPDAKQKVADALSKEERRFIIRFKKLGQRSEPCQYVTCHVEGTLRKSDRACRDNNRCCQMVRRVRARGDNPFASGNDVVFIGLVRPTSETFVSDKNLESFRMEYRTRHSIDGEIIECESRIALVTGYMTQEVNGINAMNFMHRDDVRWVIIALREMYDQHRLVGESCYRLMTKSGEFIYMQTKGFLDVDQDSRAVTSFVCTNTVVEEPVGKHLIKLMKKRFKLLVNNSEEPTPDDEEETREVTDNQTIAVEDPRQLEKVILHLVTNLPSTQPESPQSVSPDHDDSSTLRLAIIPPRKERIVSAIEKIYSIIKTFDRKPKSNMETSIYEEQKNNDEDNRQLSIRIVPLDSTSSNDSINSHSVTSLTSLENTALLKPIRKLGNQHLTTSDNIDNTASATASSNFLQIGDALSSKPQSNVMTCASIDPLLLDRLYVPQFDEGTNNGYTSPYNYENLSIVETSNSFTTSVTSVVTYTTSTITNSGAIRSDSRYDTRTERDANNFVTYSVPRYSTSKVFSFEADNRSFIRPFPRTSDNFEKSEESYDMNNLDERLLLNNESSQVNYFSPIDDPSTSYNPVEAGTSYSASSNDINYLKYVVINPIGISQSSTSRRRCPKSLQLKSSQLTYLLDTEPNRADEQNNNKLTSEVTSSNKHSEYPKERSINIASTIGSCFSLISPQAEQVTFETINLADNKTEQINYIAPENNGISDPEPSSPCGTKRVNESCDHNEVANKKMAQIILQDPEYKDDNISLSNELTTPFFEDSILCSQYLPQNDAIDSTLEQDIDLYFPDLHILDECEKHYKEDTKEQSSEMKEDSGKGDETRKIEEELIKKSELNPK